MILIAHRGNVNGSCPHLENSPLYIKEALERGYDVEVDVRIVDDVIFLGHDVPQYHVDMSFLKQPGIWAHAKNNTALLALLEANVHCFWHDTDDYTLTSRGFVWTYPGKELTSRSIAVMPSSYLDCQSAMGICADTLPIIS